MYKSIDAVCMINVEFLVASNHLTCHSSFVAICTNKGEQSHIRFESIPDSVCFGKYSSFRCVKYCCTTKREYFAASTFCEIHRRVKHIFVRVYDAEPVCGLFEFNFAGGLLHMFVIAGNWKGNPGIMWNIWAVKKWIEKAKKLIQIKKKNRIIEITTIFGRWFVVSSSDIRKICAHLITQAQCQFALVIIGTKSEQIVHKTATTINNNNNRIIYRSCCVHHHQRNHQKVINVVEIVSIPTPIFSTT